jgi:hypothetical protein
MLDAAVAAVPHKLLKSLVRRFVRHFMRRLRWFSMRY